MVSQVLAYVKDCTVCKETKPTNCGPKPEISAEVVTLDHSSIQGLVKGIHMCS